MPSTSKPRGRQVTAVQALALLLAFVLVAGLGGVLAAGLVAPVAAGAKAITDTAETAFADLPTELEEQPLSQRSTIYDANGRVITHFYHENRIVKPLDEISQEMQDAVIAIEDHRFFSHGGVDLAGVARAAVRTATGDLEGASTLTQQYVKNVLVDAANREGDMVGVELARTAEGTEGINRKLREMKVAIALEQKYSKHEILERYLNISQFGASVWGVEAAAQYFFNTSAAELDIVQAATLAGITQSPTRWDPERNPELSQHRRNIVLDRMYEVGFITAAEHREARRTPLEDTLELNQAQIGCTPAGISAFFCDYVTKVLANDPVFGETRLERTELLYRGGLEIHTTLDRSLQRAAQDEIEAGVPRDDSSGLGHAISVVEPGSGEIKAMAQNRRYSNSTDGEPWETSVNFNADFAYGGSNGFQPGSTFKPFTLVAWLEAENGLNQFIDATRRDYAPDSWTAGCIDGPPTQGTYNPFNAEGNDVGPISVMQATANSVNSGYMAMANQIDLCDIFDAAERLGATPAVGGSFDVFPATVLGTTDMSPLRMAAAYAAFAAEGEYCEPIAITRVLDHEGNELDVPDANCRQVISPDVANAVTHALQPVLTQGSARAVGPLSGGRPAVGKTGTTNMNWHSWFAGYTPQLASAVWIGNPDGNVPMRNMTINGRWYNYVWGSSISAPTWKRFMERAHEDLEPRSFTSVTDRMLTGPIETVPNVIGDTEAEARTKLGRAGFSISREVREEYHDSIAEGRISDQSYRAGSRQPKGTVITLTVSQGEDPERDCERWHPRQGPPPDHCDIDWPPDDDDEDNRGGRSFWGPGSRDDD